MADGTTPLGSFMVPQSAEDTVQTRDCTTPAVSVSSVAIL